MDCILFRHGIALDRQDWDGEDTLRPLTAEGGRKARKALAGLRRLGVVPTHLFSSPFARALQTAELAQEVFKLDDIQVQDALRPDAPPDRWLAIIASLPQEACALCVGHEPHLGAAAGVMLFGRAAAGLSLKKAGSCSVSFEGRPKAGRGVLNWWLTPAQLRALASK
jgi:phosphohistidine phosphatase